MTVKAADKVVNAGKQLVTREGWLGWVMVAATALLAFYVWDSYIRSTELNALLRASHELQRETLMDRELKTKSINALSTATEALAERSKQAADNLQQLVTLVTVGYRIDEERTTAILRQLEKVTDASKLSAEEIKKLRMLFKSPVVDLPEEP